MKHTMFLAEVKNENELTKFLAYHHGMDLWYLTSDDCLAYAFSSRERRRAAAVWRVTRKKYPGWTPKVVYRELERLCQ
jgi:hypothetical protein